MYPMYTSFSLSRNANEQEHRSAIMTFSEEQEVKNPQVAFIYFASEAENGNSYAQYKAGKMLMDGRDGVPQDVPRGREFLEKAARNGEPNAIAELAKYGDTSDTNSLHVQQTNGQAFTLPTAPGQTPPLTESLDSARFNQHQWELPSQPGYTDSIKFIDASLDNPSDGLSIAEVEAWTHLYAGSQPEAILERSARNPLLFCTEQDAAPTLLPVTVPLPIPITFFNPSYHEVFSQDVKTVLETHHLKEFLMEDLNKTMNHISCAIRGGKDVVRNATSLILARANKNQEAKTLLKKHIEDSNRIINDFKENKDNIWEAIEFLHVCEQFTVVKATGTKSARLTLSVAFSKYTRAIRIWDSPDETIDTDLLKHAVLFINLADAVKLKFDKDDHEAIVRAKIKDIEAYLDQQ